MDQPLASIIIVTYNGAHYLPACLDALQRQTIPLQAFEVIVSDNGSTDGTQELLSLQYPWARLLQNDHNLGFASGNNVAFEQARGRYLILLNNDTAPEPTWLENMVSTVDGDPRVGMVTGHLQLFYDQLVLDLETDGFAAPGDPRALGIQVAGVDSHAPRSVTQYLQGFYGSETIPGGGAIRWMQPRARLGVPLLRGEGPWSVKMLLSSGRPDGAPVTLCIRLNGNQLAEWRVNGGEPAWYSLDLPPETRSLARPVEQNTGSIVFFSGAGRDRGTYVRGDEVFFETDEGQYNRTEEVFAGCGASLLLRREMLQDVGALDDDFFMYYEDTDLSWRARLGGWKVLYAAPAYVRHIHCGTTKEWSPRFLFLIERNRLAMVFKNGDLSQVLHVWGGYLLKVMNTAWQTLTRLAVMRPGWRWHAGQLRIHLRVLWALIVWQPALWRKRLQIQRSARVAPHSLEGWFVQ